VNEFSGSYSAEHGIGPTNAAFYRRYADEPTVSLARVLVPMPK
jgi:FAD/FMN-containing dehydrogenase